MPDATTPDQRLFSYGTLQLDAVQLSTFGRLLTGRPDSLPGFQQTMVKIEDPEVVATSGKTHHPIVSHTGAAADSVIGMVFDVTVQELARADAYEVDDYVRREVTLSSGLRAWVYVDARGGAEVQGKSTASQ